MSATTIRLPLRRMAGAIAVLVAVALLAAGCSDGSPRSDGDGATDTGSADPTTGAGQDGDASDSSQAGDDGDGSPATVADGTGSGDDGAGGDATSTTGDDGAAGAVPGLCGIDEVNTQPFHAVANIDDDDPDGGLNVRDNHSGGAKLATLPEGTVVFVEDCYRRDDGAVWYTAETADVVGWVNSAFLSTTISPLQPTFGGRAPWPRSNRFWPPWPPTAGTTQPRH